MKKTMSRLLSLLLVLAMTVALVPAVLAATVTQTLNAGYTAPINGRTGHGTSKNDPYEFYVGDTFKIDRTWTDSGTSHTRVGLFEEYVSSSVTPTWTTSGSYISHATSGYYSSSSDTNYFTANRATVSSSNPSGYVGIYYGCSYTSGYGTTEARCADYVGTTYSSSSYSGSTVPVGNENISPLYFRVYDKATGFKGLTNGTTYTLVKGKSIVISNVGVEPVATAYQNIVFSNNGLVSGAYDKETKQVTLTAANDTGYTTITAYADYGTDHQKEITLNITVLDKPVVSIKKGSTVVASSTDTTQKGETLAKGFTAFELTAEVTNTTTGAKTVTWATDKYAVASISQTTNGIKVQPGTTTGDATITATLSGDTTVVASYKLKVADSTTALTVKNGSDTVTSISGDINTANMTLTATTTPEENAKYTKWELNGTGVVRFVTEKNGQGETTKYSKTVTDSNTAELEFVSNGSATMVVSNGAKSVSIPITVKNVEQKYDVTAARPRMDYVARKTSNNTLLLEQFNKAYPTVSCLIKSTIGQAPTLGDYPVPITWIYVKSSTDKAAKIVGYLADSDGDYTFGYDHVSQIDSSLASLASIEGNVLTVTASLTDDAIVASNKITASKTGSFMPNEKVTFTCEAASDPTGATLTYVWKVNGSIQTGVNEKTFTYTIPDSSKDSSKEYKVTCDVTATKNSKTSAALTSNEIVLNVLRDYSVELTLGTSASSYTVGQSIKATARVYKNGSAQSSYTNFTWTVNDPTSGNALASSLATVTGNGADGTMVIKGISTTLGKNDEEQMSIKASVIIEGNVYSAEKTITAKAATAADVKMAAGSGVNMNTTAMSQAINKALGNTAVTPSYVQFSAEYGGKLYKSSTSSTVLGSTTSCYLVSSNSNSQKLADVYYKPASSTGDRHVDYRVFDSSNNVIATGKVVFDESVVSGLKISMLGDSFKNSGAYAEIADSYSNLGYVTFEAPETAVGKLFYNYNGGQGSEAITSASKFYANASSSQLDLNKLYFLPAADCAASLKIKYTAYSTGGTVINNGELTFAVTKKTNSTTFSDVTASLNLSWAADSVDFMADLGIITGTGGTKFSPNNSLIRGDLVLMLYRMAGKPQVIGVENPFEDVKPTDYYYDAVMWAYSKGVVSGTSEKTFSPKNNITRQQIAAILWRYAGQPAAAGSIAAFNDSNKVESYAVEAMKWAVGKGYITGTSTTTLNPAGNATRAQVAVMLHRFLTK